MNKKGFTLAEVLVTLGIIGVITALTIPTFTQKTSTAKVGPQLAKAVATYEQAVKALLADADADMLFTAYVCPADSDTCAESEKVLLTTNRRTMLYNIAHYMNSSITAGNAPVIKLSDGVTYRCSFADGCSFTTPTASNSRFASEISLIRSLPSHPTCTLQIDINGDGNPNKDGYDRFYFSMWGDGSLRPKGSQAWTGASDAPLWSDDDRCPNGKRPIDPTFCAGSIFANSLKVQYKKGF